MSLLLLYRPTTSVVVTPPETPPIIPQGAEVLVPPPAIYRFPAGTASILVRAKQPQLILVPSIERARILIGAHRPEVQLELTSKIRKHPAPSTYRAVRDDKREDQEYLELVEAAFLLTR